jgi:hypothetical protein
MKIRPPAMHIARESIGSSSRYDQRIFFDAMSIASTVRPNPKE